SSREQLRCLPGDKPGSGKVMPAIWRCAGLCRFVVAAKAGNHGNQSVGSALGQWITRRRRRQISGASSRRRQPGEQGKGADAAQLRTGVLALERDQQTRAQGKAQGTQYRAIHSKVASAASWEEDMRWWPGESSANSPGACRQHGNWRAGLLSPSR
ncbi:MAG TPA: hypothetical protein VLA64_00615, partial [Azonexus sp.]|nr:hypothetical protein [Azonexus sp.]